MPSFTKMSITAEAAKATIGGAAGKATQLGLIMCIAITDESGDLKVFLRMDGTAKLALEIFQNKAFTAVSFGIATHEWWEFIKNDAPLFHGITHTPRLVVVGGGYPIKDGDQIIGAIGLSGGHYTQDMEVAKAGDIFLRVLQRRRQRHWLRICGGIRITRAARFMDRGRPVHVVRRLEGSRGRGDTDRGTQRANHSLSELLNELRNISVREMAVGQANEQL